MWQEDVSPQTRGNADNVYVAHGGQDEDVSPQTRGNADNVYVAHGGQDTNITFF
ncbi:hypothetical protein J6590_068420 [Homalodisca vitripennis]|nr:hypothetical protein J6590_068420 [Homalodisca vitripennis]